MREDEKLVEKDGKEFASLELWNVKPLLKDTEYGVNINFELSGFVKASIEFLKKTISGDSSRQAQSGDSSRQAQSGYFSRQAQSGDSSTQAQSGDFSRQAQSGDSSTQAQSGDSSRQEANGKDGVSVNAGANCSFKGKIGNWFCLAEWKEDKPICLKAGFVDGKKIKEDTWYQLKNGKFIEVK